MTKKILPYLQYLLPQRGLSRLAGMIASSQTIWLKNLLIKQFIRRYQIDLSAAQFQKISDYASFHDFFTRALKPEYRPIADDPEVICSPVDGRVSQFGQIHHASVLQAKGINYSLDALLPGGTELYRPFVDGQFITLYLSPADYHRVHMPVAGTLVRADYVPGQLFAVNEASVHTIKGLFSRNERLVCYFDTELGKMALIMVGALLVAGIKTVWTSQQQIALPKHPLSFAKGEEIGHFTFGSTVILLFDRQARISWELFLQRELQLQFGQEMAQFHSTSQVSG